MCSARKGGGQGARFITRTAVLPVSLCTPEANRRRRQPGRNSNGINQESRSNLLRARNSGRSNLADRSTGRNSCWLPGTGLRRRALAGVGRSDRCRPRQGPKGYTARCWRMRTASDGKLGRRTNLIILGLHVRMLKTPSTRSMYKRGTCLTTVSVISLSDCRHQNLILDQDLKTHFRLHGSADVGKKNIGSNLLLSMRQDFLSGGAMLRTPMESLCGVIMVSGVTGSAMQGGR